MIPSRSLHYRLMTATLLLAFTTTSAYPAEWKRVAYSKSQGLEVLAETRNGEWCQTDVTVKLVAEQKAFFDADTPQKFLHKLGPVLLRECPTVQSLTLAGTAKDDVTFSYSARTTDASSWALSDAKTEIIAKETTSPEPEATNATNTPPPQSVPKAPPISLSYNQLLFNYANRYESAIATDSFKANLASIYDCKSVLKAGRNEFQLRELADKAFKTFEEERKDPPSQYTYTIKTQFGEYDHNAQAFAFSPLTGSFRFSSGRSIWCFSSGSDFPDKFHTSPTRADGISRIDMPTAEAKKFLASRTKQRWSRTEVDRTVYLQMTVQIKDMQMSGYGNARMAYEIIEARVFTDNKFTKQIAYYSQEELAEAIRVADETAAKEAERLRLQREHAERESVRQRELAVKEYERQQALRKADSEYRFLLKADISRRLAYMMGKQNRLTTPTNSIGWSLMWEKPSKGTLLIHTKTEGTENVETHWPKRISVNTAEGGNALEKDKWYLIYGSLTPKLYADLPTASVDIETLISCEMPACEEANDITELVLKKHGDIGWGPERVTN